MDSTEVSEQANSGAGVSSANVAVEEPAAEAEPDDALPPQSATANQAESDVQLDAASLMEQFLSDPSHDYKSLKYGDVMDGVIMHVDREELLVDIGSKSEGVVPAREYSSLSQEEKQGLNIGDTVLVFVVQPENQEGHAVVSIDRARQEKSWRRLQELFEANEVIEAEVTNYNKGGLLVNLDGVRGFVPASQVSEIRGGDEASKQADMARLIGTSLPLKVIEINRHRNRLILSERQAVQERRDVMKERLIEELKEGEVRKGRVSSICDFGAFVDIGGADGLVHLSELSWSRVRHPSEVLRVGQEVDVHVLGINPQEKKIALSIKRTQAEPWSRVATNYDVGQLVRATVTQLANFGAFARIEDGIEGLIHVSELADERVTHPKQVVSEGQDLLLRIIRIDPQRRRMGLSLRRALDTPDNELVTVFGEEVLEERDQLVQRIRASLEAEGIDANAALGGGEPATEPTTDSSSKEVPTAAADAAVEQTATAPEADAPSAESRAEAATPATSPGTRSSARSRAAQPRPAVELLPDLDGEPLSAMAMAFAMAGAPTDLDAHDADKQDQESGAGAPTDLVANDADKQESGSVEGSAAAPSTESSATEPAPSTDSAPAEPRPSTESAATEPADSADESDHPVASDEDVPTTATAEGETDTASTAAVDDDDGSK